MGTVCCVRTMSDCMDCGIFCKADFNDIILEKRTDVLYNEYILKRLEAETWTTEYTLR